MPLVNYADLARDWAKLPYDEPTKNFMQGYGHDSVFVTADVLGWNDLTRLTQYFQDPASLREPFQEVLIDPRQVFYSNASRRAGERLSIALDQACFDGSPSETVSVWVNGRTIYNGRPAAKAPAPVLDLSPDLVPGENLVILRKERGQTELARGEQLALDRALLGLATNSKLVATVREPGTVGAYRIERSLPGLVDRYAIYLTILRPAESAPVDVRLETELGWVASLLSARPITWELGITEPQTGSLVRGQIGILDGGRRPASEVRLAPRTPDPSQSLDVEFPADIRVDDLFINLFGVQVREKALAPVPLNVKGRLQWVRTSPKLRGAGHATPTFALCRPRRERASRRAHPDPDPSGGPQARPRRGSGPPGTGRQLRE